MYIKIIFKASISYHSGQQHSTHYYLVQYTPSGPAQDGLSKSLLRYKHNDFQDRGGWLDYAHHEIQSVAWPENGLVVRALHSYEHDRIFRRKPLDYLGNRLALALGWKYTPALIRKLWPTQKAHQLFSKEQRSDEFLNNYILNENFGYMKDTPVLIVDDIVTTGITMTAILNAFNDRCIPENLTTFSFAKTGYEPGFNQQLQIKGDLFTYDHEKGWITNPA